MVKGFGSDNHSGVHPNILQAVVDANPGHAPAYGTDHFTKAANEVIQSHFGKNAESHFVFNGTAANVLAIGSLVRPYHAVIASEQAHVINDECGAPERIIGCKMISIPTPDGKLTPELIRPVLRRRGDQHASQAHLITITQPTEIGTVYTIEEIKRITAFAKAEGLKVHVDGARLVNAAASLGCTLSAMTTDCGVDAVSLGGTKNALLFGEAVVFLKPGLAVDFKYLRKQQMQLPSKTRFIAAQFSAWLGTDLWLTNAQTANRMAKRLSDGLSQSKHIQLTQKTQANGVFARIPKWMVPRLRESYFFYVWDEATFECRLMTSWDTTEAEIDAFIRLVEKIGNEYGPAPGDSK